MTHKQLDIPIHHVLITICLSTNLHDLWWTDTGASGIQRKHIFTLDFNTNPTHHAYEFTIGPLLIIVAWLRKPHPIQE